MNILFADDHALVRESISEQIARLEADARIVQVGSLDEALAALSDEIQIVILDLQMPGMNGLQGIERMKQAAGARPIVVLSGFVDRRTIRAVLDTGISGFVPKTASGKTLHHALRMVRDGERYIPAAALDGEDGPSLFERESMARPGPRQDSPFQLLTEREAQIVRLLVAGNSNKEIGLQLGLQEITIKIHLRNVYRKIGASNRADAVRLSFEHNFVGE